MKDPFLEWFKNQETWQNNHMDKLVERAVKAEMRAGLVRAFFFIGLPCFLLGLWIGHLA